MTTKTQKHTNIWAALIAAKADFGPVLKTARGQFGKYPNLETVLDAIDPALQAHGLWAETFPYSDERGDFIGLTIRHAESDGIAGPYYEPVILEAQTAQKRGSGVTYARRYLLMTVFGLAAEDDDGQAASTPQIAKRNGSKPEPQVSIDEADELNPFDDAPPWGSSPRSYLDLDAAAVTAKTFTSPAQAQAWADLLGIFEAHKHTVNSYEKLKREIEPESAAEMWAAWIVKCGNKVLEKEAAA